jgi:hypothetical protein
LKEADLLLRKEKDEASLPPCRRQDSLMPLFSDLPGVKAFSFLEPSPPALVSLERNPFRLSGGNQKSKVSMKKISCAVAIGCFALSAVADPYYFQSASGESAWLNVDAWTGTGVNESILVVDWNIYGPDAPYQNPSHAFGFRWDGTVTEADMLNAFNDAGIFSLTTGYGGAFLYDIVYHDGAQTLSHADESGSWNMARANTPNAQWGVWGTGNGLGDWYDNQAGIDQQELQNGWLNGINAITWFNGDPNAYMLDVPIATVPEPSAAALCLVGGCLLLLVRVVKRPQPASN